jgi:3-phenylpropionate/trans-cinnamate dioxygenase ferredoxin subunit
MGSVISNTVELGKAGDLADGAMKEVTVNGKQYLVARVKDKYYAADGRCPHMGGVLSTGKLEGTILTCPRHHSQFDLKDGHVIRWTDWTGLKLSFARALKTPRSLKTYTVSIQGDRIVAEL